MPCNGYGGGPDSGRYVARDDGTLAVVGALAVTVQLCSEPEGIMEQEAAYINALTRVAAYRLMGDRLEPRDASVGAALVYVR
jgi:heat shock protein HslJ